MDVFGLFQCFSVNMGDLSKLFLRKPFFTGSCDVVECPANSAGKNVAKGCSCLPGPLGRTGEGLLEKAWGCWFSVLA